MKRLFALLVVAATLSTPSALASTGPLYVAANTILTEDHTGNVVVTADNITLDCGGHRVSSAAPGVGVGILIERHSGVTVRNCFVSGFDKGFFLVGASRNTLTENHATGNNTGFFIVSSDADANGNLVADNVASDNHDTGFNTSGWGTNPVDGTIYTGNVANNNTWFGFGAWRATGNAWRTNTANGNGHWGFALFRDVTTGNVLEANSASGNGESGFLLLEAVSNTLTANTSTHNVGSGFVFDSAHANNAVGNDGGHNAQVGFWLVGGSSANSLSDNSANFEGWTGFDIGDGSSNNSLSSNVANGNLTGFYVEGGSGIAPAWNTLTANNATNNVYNGFAVSNGATHTTFLRDIANNNRFDNGFAVYGDSTYTTVSGCVGHGNGQYDALDAAWAWSTDIWTDNKFGTTSPAGLG